jgi:hypothetical protein
VQLVGCRGVGFHLVDHDLLTDERKEQQLDVEAVAVAMFPSRADFLPKTPLSELSRLSRLVRIFDRKYSDDCKGRAPRQARSQLARVVLRSRADRPVLSRRGLGQPA